MTSEQWLQQARRDVDKLKALVASYHPSSKGFPRRNKDVHITAPMAEAACQAVRQRIKMSSPDFDPVVAIDHALEDGNIGALISILNGAWFGVPESRSCWQIEGFSEAVALLEDMPEEQGEEL